VRSIQNSQAVKYGAAPKNLGEKICEIKGGGQKMLKSCPFWKQPKSWNLKNVTPCNLLVLSI